MTNKPLPSLYWQTTGSPLLALGRSAVRVFPEQDAGPRRRAHPVRPHDRDLGSKVVRAVFKHLM